MFDNANVLMRHSMTRAALRHCIRTLEEILAPENSVTRKRFLKKFRPQELNIDLWNIYIAGIESILPELLGDELRNLFFCLISNEI